MIYGHQIKQADAFITNLDIGISRLVWNGNLTKIIAIVKINSRRQCFFSVFVQTIQIYSLKIRVRY